MSEFSERSYSTQEQVKPRQTCRPKKGRFVRGLITLAAFSVLATLILFPIAAAVLALLSMVKYVFGS